MKKVALISGITGQDRSFLTEFLIEKGCEVHSLLHRSSSFNKVGIEHLYLNEWVRDMKKERLVNLHHGNMTDLSSLIRLIFDQQKLNNCLVIRLKPELYLGGIPQKTLLKNWWKL